MHGTNYNVALLVVFIPFILCETPSNLVLKFVSPKTWLSVLLFGCGESFSHGPLLPCARLMAHAIQD